MIIKKVNRIKKLQPKSGKFYCHHCDHAIVGNWEKCPVCGLRSGKKTIKK
jgi:rubrerythrin